MLLGMIVERCSGVPLQEFFRDRIASLAGASQLGFVPTEWADNFLQCARRRGGDVAPTEHDTWRGRLLCGEVHDENAASLGGVAGHAGLFGTAEAVLAVTGAWLQAYHRRSSMLDAAPCQRVYLSTDCCAWVELGIGMGYSIASVIGWEISARGFFWPFRVYGDVGMDRSAS